MRGPLLLLSAAVAAIVLGLKALLRLPGVPYNVSELFLDGGSAWRLTLFAVAVLWIGAGPVLAARWLRGNRRPLLALPISMIALAMVSRTLLKYSVTYESLDDILGTNNLYARVTNEHIWGELWRRAFLSTHALDLVSYVERRVRFIALYSPLAVCLTLACLTTSVVGRPRYGRSQIAGLLITAIAWVWLSLTIVFTWAATDNLTELVADSGRFGVGGRFYLLLLALLLAINVRWLLSARGSGRRWLMAIALSIAAIPVGWLLLQLGLEQHIQKYGLVFSGTQFLLGANRQLTLSHAALFARWTAVQIAAVAVIFTGAVIVARLAPVHGNNSVRP
jgi:hypothetical protein